MRAGSGLPVAGSGAEARVCSKKACAESAPKNGKLFIAIRHSLPSLPRSTSVLLPSSHTTGKSDRRTSEWRWVDTEWRVAGVVGVSSTTYTPAASTTATEAQREEASQREHVEVPDEVRRYARPADMPSASMDVDAEGWQYGDNAWDKFSKQNGMGRYTRRRRWLRKAVLVQTVEYGV